MLFCPVTKPPEDRGLDGHPSSLFTVSVLRICPLAKISQKPTWIISSAVPWQADTGEDTEG